MAKKKHIIVILLLLAVFGFGMVLGAPASSPLNMSHATVAYADGCDGPHPPPDLDCPKLPTPTPTQDPGH
ncbi:MAG TPA: hypothetical protein VJ183_19325 [Chloroflexia bacterium]|nr:hypothetical protein [Chloroflexia bacterium]